MRSINASSGSVFGGMLLVAGGCIGAGMLALPIVTGLSGFFPSILMLFLSWAFMTFTGLLLVEANGWFEKPVNLISITQHALGSKGRLVCWICYLCLFYSILVAYISASGSIFSVILKQLLAIEIPRGSASIFFTLFFGLLIYLGTRPVDLLNRLLMAGLIITYFGIIFLGVSYIEPALLFHDAPSYMFAALPILVISFGFQNLIPSLMAYMKGDVIRVRLTIVGGSFITLAVYVVWSILALGILSPELILESYHKGQEATEAMQQVLGSSLMAGFFQGFAFFAIVTSFIAQGLTLSQFLADGFKVNPIGKKGRLFTFLALAPPLVFALYNPQIFFKALDLAGGIFAMVLFGFLPIAMIWVGRYKKNFSTPYHVAGGKISLGLALLFALFVIGIELSHLLG